MIKPGDIVLFNVEAMKGDYVGGALTNESFGLVLSAMKGTLRDQYDWWVAIYNAPKDHFVNDPEVKGDNRWMFANYELTQTSLIG